MRKTSLCQGPCHLASSGIDLSPLAWLRPGHAEAVPIWIPDNASCFMLWKPTSYAISFTHGQGGSSRDASLRPAKLFIVVGTSLLLVAAVGVHGSISGAFHLPGFFCATLSVAPASIDSPSSPLKPTVGPTRRMFPLRSAPSPPCSCGAVSPQGMKACIAQLAGCAPDPRPPWV